MTRLAEDSGLFKRYKKSRGNDNDPGDTLIELYLEKELKKAEERADSNQKKVDTIDEELKVWNEGEAITDLL